MKNQSIELKNSLNKICSEYNELKQDKDKQNAEMKAYLENFNADKLSKVNIMENLSIESF